jgi:hypothetical protein
MAIRLTSRRSKRCALAASAALIAVGASGCVPTSQYDSARSALETEQASNRRMMNELYEARQKLSAAQSETRARDEKATQQDDALAQAELDESIQSQKRQNAAELVDQLREELGRVAEHLKFFVGQNTELKQQLAAAQVQDQRLAANALVVRDLALMLHDQLATGEAELTVVNGAAVLRVASSRMFEASGHALSPASATVFSAVARVGELHKKSRIGVSEVGLPAGVAQTERAARVKLVADALAHAGLDANRIGAAPPAARAASAATASEALPAKPAPASPAPAAPELDITIDAAPS